MERLQLILSDASYASALREMLVRDGTWDVVCAEAPDSGWDGVIVLDPAGLDRLPSPVPHPERVVLITRNDPQYLSRAWEEGIISVVFDHDPLNTAMLAIMAAGLRLAKSVRGGLAHNESANGPDAPLEPQYLKRSPAEIVKKLE